MARYTPIIIISARSSEVHRILGWSWAPTTIWPSLSRCWNWWPVCKALLRRTDALARNARMESGSLTLGELDIDPWHARCASMASSSSSRRASSTCCTSSPATPDKVFSRLDLLNQVWGYQHDGYEHTVNTHINRLRTKVETDPAQPRRILTVWGHGYKLSTSANGEDAP